MSLTRHKPFIEIVFLLSLFLLAQLGGAFAAASLEGWSAPSLGTTDRFALDRTSGLALRGFDPVSYFEAGKPRAGVAQHEAVWRGVAWRFGSEANRAAFLEHPEVYGPQFDGLDAESAARGLVVEADPTVFAIARGRLYLFRTAGARDRFLADESAVTRAEQSWSALGRQLAN